MNYIMMWVGAEGERIICNQLVAAAGIADGYFEAFGQYVRPVRKFHVARHRFYQLKQDKDELIDTFILQCRYTLEECHFPEEKRDIILLDCVIFGGKHKECQRKLLSKGEDLTLDRTLGIVHAKEVTDASYNEVFERAANQWKQSKEFSRVKLNPDHCYNLEDSM